MAAACRNLNFSLRYGIDNGADKTIGWKFKLWKMNYETYKDLKIQDDYKVFEFISEGKQGSIPKRVTFSETNWEGVYNLGFGDIGNNGEIDDYVISDNGDRNKGCGSANSIVHTRYGYNRIFG